MVPSVDSHRRALKLIDIARVGGWDWRASRPDVAHCQAGNDGEAGGAEAIVGVVTVLLVVTHPDVHDGEGGLAPPRPQQLVRALLRQD